MNRRDKLLRWLAGVLETPPVSTEARRKAGLLLRRLQRGVALCRRRLRQYDGRSGVVASRVAGKRGWVEGSVEELLGLEPWETELIELRLALADAVRERRARQGLSQKELADRVGSTQPRVARLEQAEGSLDAILRAVFALGASRDEVGCIVAKSRRPASRKRPTTRSKTRKQIALKRPKSAVRRSA